MIFSNKTIELIKEKSGLSFDRTSDFSILATLIQDKTKFSLGVTTLKRLFGYIGDPRETNKATLNIVAQYLDYQSWEEYVSTLRIDSDWDVESDTVWIAELSIGTVIEVAYLNRTVVFEVVKGEEGKVLRVADAKNSSLHKNDIAYIDRIRKGEKIEARKVCRGLTSGSYRTNGEIKSINIISKHQE